MQEPKKKKQHSFSMTKKTLSFSKLQKIALKNMTQRRQKTQFKKPIIDSEKKYEKKTSFSMTKKIISEKKNRKKTSCAAGPLRKYPGLY